MTKEGSVMEAGVVLDLQGQPLYWHLPPDRSMGYLPDSRDLWDVLWENRKNLSGLAHSHPGSGIPGPSHEDVTTFAAVEAGLGFRLDWYIASRDGLSLGRWAGPHRLTYLFHAVAPRPWLARLREVSYGQEVYFSEKVPLSEDAVLTTLGYEREGEILVQQFKGRNADEKGD